MRYERRGKYENGIARLEMKILKRRNRIAEGGGLYKSLGLNYAFYSYRFNTIYIKFLSLINFITNILIIVFWFRFLHI